MQYHKIQTMFKRNPETNYKSLLIGDWAREEFAYLSDMPWEWTEKIDGTNIRVIWEPPWRENLTGSLEFRGKTDRAQIPQFLLDKLNEMFDEEAFRHLYPQTSMCIYGEGYGAKIQKGGGNYIPDGVSFIAFDVAVFNMDSVTWLRRPDVEDIARNLSVDSVPIVGEGTLMESVDLVSRGFKSKIGKAESEGLVLRPKVYLSDRMGRRIITKLKHKDFLG